VNPKPPRSARKGPAAARAGAFLALAAVGLAAFAAPALLWGAEGAPPIGKLDLADTWYGYLSLGLFVLAYLLVMAEEFIHLRKSKPVMVAAGVIWALVAVAYARAGDTTTAALEIRHNLLDYAELMLFLLAAMTYINTMSERNVFKALRAWLVSAGYSLRTVFWVTGLLAFFISPVADNLTTALVMAAVVTAVGTGNDRFVAVACINIVVAANAGGAFSPFGDITTLMVWQHGVVRFHEFFDLWLPSALNWLVPALCMSFTVPKTKPQALHEEVRIKHGGFVVIALFVLTIALAVAGHNYLHVPPVMGMMTGLGILKVYGYRLALDEATKLPPHIGGPEEVRGMDYQKSAKPFDIFDSMRLAEWDTLMFFYGVILCVGGLGTIGYLAGLSHLLYTDLGPTWANVTVGLISAIVDNIPVMFAVLTMEPHMAHGQWLLVTLTAGVGGSLFSIGSAAGVGLMGQARGVYTFFSHLKWTWAVALGYVVSILAHLWFNAGLMTEFR
jgi:Na+/H+ antiporter NhaD/arsenite permease-like protein